MTSASDEQAAGVSAELAGALNMGGVDGEPGQSTATLTAAVQATADDMPAGITVGQWRALVDAVQQLARAAEAQARGPDVVAPEGEDWRQCITRQVGELRDAMDSHDAVLTGLSKQARGW
jgi:hypothetical protein